MHQPVASLGETCGRIADVREELEMAAADKLVIGETQAADDPESGLIAFLLDVEALGAGEQPLMWLTKDGVHLATEGFADELSVPDTPSMKNLYAEYTERAAAALLVRRAWGLTSSKQSHGCKTPKAKVLRRSTDSRRAGRCPSTTELLGQAFSAPIAQ